MSFSNELNIQNFKTFETRTDVILWRIIIIISIGKKLNIISRYVRYICFIFFFSFELRQRRGELMHAAHVPTSRMVSGWARVRSKLKATEIWKHWKGSWFLFGFLSPQYYHFSHCQQRRCARARVLTFALILLLLYIHYYHYLNVSCACGLCYENETAHIRVYWLCIAWIKHLNAKNIEFILFICLHIPTCLRVRTAIEPSIDSHTHFQSLFLYWLSAYYDYRVMNWFWFVSDTQRS